MLPPGHIAAGYLTSTIFLKLIDSPLPPADQNILILWGTFFGFAPDLDFFVAFKKTKSLTISDEINHRDFYSHAPILWLAGGLIVSFYGMFINNAFVELFGFMLWLGSWTHFALDTIQHGIMWLWPWNKRLIALRDRNSKTDVKADKFIVYWLSFLKFYATKMSLSFYLELVIITTAIIVYFS